MISLIATVLNERINISAWLDGLLTQTKLPDEIVIVDGGSTDGTWEWLRETASQNSLLKVFQHKGNIASGRNFAIKNAQGNRVVVTDAGCIYDKNWFASIATPFTEEKKFIATAFGPWFDSNTALIPRLIAASTTPAPAEFHKDWLPSSRSVAFSKELWQNVGGYPEWIPICEDIIFDLKIFKAGTKPDYIRKPLVFWEPRQNLLDYCRQLFRYTKSDGHGKLWLGRQLTRYFVYSAAIIILVCSIILDWRLVFLLLAGCIIYMFKFWDRWLQYSNNMSLGARFFGTLILPIVVALGDVAKMCGWPIGVFERWTGNVKFQKY